MPRITTNSYFLGLDLGQRRDYTAISVIETATIVHEARDPLTFAFLEERRLAVAALERLPLNTSYPAVVERVSGMIHAIPLRNNCTLIVDATGVGQAVYDMLRRNRLPVRELIGVQITSGDRTSRDAGLDRIPRKLLLHNLHARTIDKGYCIAAGLEHARTLIRELSQLQVILDEAGNETIAPAKDSQHDDLVFATALALWFANQPEAQGTRFNGPVPYALSGHL